MSHGLTTKAILLKLDYKLLCERVHNVPSPENNALYEVIDGFSANLVALNPMSKAPEPACWFAVYVQNDIYDRRIKSIAKVLQVMRGIESVEVLPRDDRRFAVLQFPRTAKRDF